MTLTPNTPAADDTGHWVDVCGAERLQPGRGVCALVGSSQVAVFRLTDGSLHAIDNIDPCSGAAVLSRGLTGEHVVEGRTIHTVASPMHKQRFDLESGRCLDADASVDVWPVTETGTRVMVGCGPASPIRPGSPTRQDSAT